MKRQILLLASVRISPIPFDTMAPMRASLLLSPKAQKQFVKIKHNHRFGTTRQGSMKNALACTE